MGGHVLCYRLLDARLQHPREQVGVQAVFQVRAFGSFSEYRRIRRCVHLQSGAGSPVRAGWLSADPASIPDSTRSETRPPPVEPCPGCALSRLRRGCDRRLGYEKRSVLLPLAQRDSASPDSHTLKVVSAESDGARSLSNNADTHILSTTLGRVTKERNKDTHILRGRAIFRIALGLAHRVPRVDGHFASS